MLFLCNLNALLSQLLYQLCTLFLFTKSDLKTVVFPVTSLAAASAPLASMRHLTHTIFWNWIHVLQADLANQTVHPEEDEQNKPFRPLPAKRITKTNARRLRWASVPACLILSACYSMEVVCASLSLAVLIIIYNEAGLSNRLFLRNVVNAAAYMCFGIGASLIAGPDHHHLDGINVCSVMCCAGIVLTTVQAQDFKDTVGDRLIGRKTFAIVAPGLARPALFVSLLIWSSILAVIWKLDVMLSLMIHCLALLVGGRYVLFKDVKADQRSYYLYNVWLAIASALPVYFRCVVARSRG